MKYTYLMHPHPDGYYATFPDIPLLVVAGMSIPQVEQMIPSAIKIHHTSLREQGIELPRPVVFAKNIEVE
jgi:predicted RNase H-like HicB family nuclease